MAYQTMNKMADSGLFVVESIHQYKHTVHENITIDWRRRRPEEEPPNFLQQLDFMAEDLDASRGGLVSSLEAYLNESSVNTDFTEVRDDAAGDMSRWYQFIRDICLKSCGEKATKELGFNLVTERHPWRLDRQAQRAINVAKKHDPDAKVEVDDPIKQEAAVRYGYIVTVLEPPHERLAGILETWIRQRKGTEKTLIRKDAALETYQRKFSIYAANAESLYRWAGLDEEAKRIKPSLRKPGQRQVEDSESQDTGASDDPSDQP